MNRYRMIESVGHRTEPVHGYHDLEIHHPSHHGHQPGRSYASVDGRREEVLKARTSGGNLMVSKDFILTDERGSTRVPVPSPAAGYVGKVDARNGLVGIYDHKGGELVAQVRHMDLHGSGLHEGQTVAYGQPLGIQAGYGGGKPDAYGVHTHIDFNTARLTEFKRYLDDIDRGAIAVGATPGTPAEPHRPNSAVRHVSSHADVPHEAGQTDAAAQRWQSALAHLGYTGRDGRIVKADGVFGPSSRHAAEQFQRDHEMPVNGNLDAETRARLAAEERTMASTTHPAHGLFRQSLDAVRQLDRQLRVPSGAHTVAIAGCVAAEAVRSGLSRIDRVDLGEDRRFVRGVELGNPTAASDTVRTTAGGDVGVAVRTPLANSSDEAAVLHERLVMTAHRQHIDRAPMRVSVL